MKRVCNRCVMDSEIPGVSFDERGICNFCRIHDSLESKYPLNDETEEKLAKIIAKIKNSSKGNYDCVVGISGGVDSTFLLYIAVKLGLKPLAVHWNNGWNTKIAEANMKNAIKKLGVDCKVVEANGTAFNDLNRAFLHASVSDADIPNDIAIYSTLYRTAAEEGIKYNLNGHSFRTEGTQPFRWSYMDGRYIKDVHNKFGTYECIPSYPNLTMKDLFYFLFVKRLKTFRMLYYLDYNKTLAKNLIKRELNFKDYGEHHCENIYTAFIATYLLPLKFGIDKRKVEYSALIRSGQMKSRNLALKVISKPPVPNMKYVDAILKELGISHREFMKILRTPPKTFMDYKTYYSLIRKCRVFIKLACKTGMLPQTMYEKYFN